MTDIPNDKRSPLEHERDEALLPCPFCGGEAERHTLPADEFGNAGGDVIECSGCGASSHVEFGRSENLVSIWNCRAALTAQLVAQEPVAGTPITMTYRNYRGEIDRRTVVPTRIWFGSTDWHPERVRANGGIIARAEVTGLRVLADCQFADLAHPATPAPVEAGDHIPGWDGAIAWLEKQHEDYVAEHGIYDPETGATEFRDGGEYESSLIDLIDGMKSARPRLRAQSAPVETGLVDGVQTWAACWSCEDASTEEPLHLTTDLRWDGKGWCCDECFGIPEDGKVTPEGGEWETAPRFPALRAQSSPVAPVTPPPASDNGEGGE